MASSLDNIFPWRNGLLIWLFITHLDVETADIFEAEGAVGRVPRCRSLGESLVGFSGESGVYRG